MPKDLFAPVPEFLVAFDNILKNGFFEDIQFGAHGKMMEGKIYACFITAIGCVPSNKKYGADGCGAIIDPHTVIASCRALVKKKKVKNVSTKVETEEWPLWDTAGEKKIGSKGKRTELKLYVEFNT